MGEKSWRAEMPDDFIAVDDGRDEPLRCVDEETHRSLVVRANAELDAKDAWIEELERERDAALAKVTELESMPDNRAALALVRTLDRGELPIGNSLVETAVRNRVESALARAEKAETELANLRWDNEMMRCPRCNNPTDGPPCEVCKARAELAARRASDYHVMTLVVFVGGYVKKLRRDSLVTCAHAYLADAPWLKKEGE